MSNNDEFLQGYKEVPSSWIKWGKPGNKIKGTLIDTFEVEDNYKGTKQPVYVIKIEAGEFNNIVAKKVDEAVTILDKGSVWNVGGRYSIDRVMRNLKLGTRIAMIYIEDVDTPKGTAKSFNVLAGGIDTEWVATQAVAQTADALNGTVIEEPNLCL